MEKLINIPDGVEHNFENVTLSIKGPKGEVKKKFNQPLIKITEDSNNLKLTSLNERKATLSYLNTFESRIKSMIEGVLNPYIYKLKVCSSHFPMNVSVSGNKLIVKNYIGEKKSREIVFFDNVFVKMDGEIIEVSSCDKDLAGSQAGVIESQVRVTNRDRRKFQDGIYIIEKAGNKI